MDKISNNYKLKWVVYIILASDNSLYTGITTNLKRRWKQHCGKLGGARFFRGRKPMKLVYLEPGHDRSSASKREAEIKKLTRASKQKLLTEGQNICHLWQGRPASIEDTGYP